VSRFHTNCAIIFLSTFNETQTCTVACDCAQSWGGGPAAATGHEPSTPEPPHASRQLVLTPPAHAHVLLFCTAFRLLPPWDEKSRAVGLSCVWGARAGGSRAFHLRDVSRPNHVQTSMSLGFYLQTSKSGILPLNFQTRSNYFSVYPRLEWSSKRFCHF
jgi:hypothetical protein